MHLFRIIAAVGAAAWAAKKLSGPAKDRYQRGGVTRRTGARSSITTSGTSREPKPSAAPAASGAFRDDRDVAGVGALREDEVPGR